MVRQAHQERNQLLAVRPELVEGLNQSFLNYVKKLIICAFNPVYKLKLKPRNLPHHNPKTIGDYIERGKVQSQRCFFIYTVHLIFDGLSNDEFTTQNI